MLTVALVVGALMAVTGLRTSRVRRQALRRSAAQEARLRVDRQRLVATRLGTREAARPASLLPRCPECGEAFRVVGDLWAHLDEHR
jgi:Zn finger protein HypA/HybF involved in hydrogenase expression